MREESKTSVCLHFTGKERIRSNDFTGHAGFGSVHDALSAQFIRVDQQMLLDVLTSFPETPTMMGLSSELSEIHFQESSSTC